ncbi:NDR1/HIN1-like protein 26 [Curcuma longa]|uniref:NDR1/HIN1-like protein 26 n=1 Tax=Curcuma longa TaxID=136217 RepID=UPI003D9E1BE2
MLDVRNQESLPRDPQFLIPSAASDGLHSIKTKRKGHDLSRTSSFCLLFLTLLLRTETGKITASSLMATPASEPPKPTAVEPVIGYPASNSDAPPLSPPVPAYPAATHFNRNPNYSPFRGGYNDRPAPSSCDAIYRRIIFSIVVAFLSVGAVTFLLWLILRPRAPDFSVSSATVSSFNLSTPSDADPQMSSSFDIALSISNPNKKIKIWYEALAVAVGYDDYILAETTLPPFDQENGNFTMLRATLEAAGEHVGTDVATGMSDDRASSDGMAFQVMVESWIWFKARLWRTSGSLMRVYCEDIKIAFANKTASSGSMVGPAKKCQVKL